jgi:hypothetical protein
VAAREQGRATVGRFIWEREGDIKKEIKRNMEVHFINLVEICKSMPCHVSTDSGPILSETMLIELNSIISAH